MPKSENIDETKQKGIEAKKSRQLNELKRNTIIIAIANLGSKAISFILAPLYSYYLTTSEYGTMDLITTTAALLMPLLCLDIYEATFRFASDNNEKVVFSSSFSLSFSFSALAMIIVTLLRLCFHVPDLATFSIFAAAIDANYMVLSQFARGRGRMKVFAFSGVVNSLFTLGFNAIFLVLLHLGLYGWMATYIIAKLIVCVYVFVRIQAWNSFSLKCINRAFYKEAIRYGLPLLPTASMWWVMNASDRYMIAIFIGTAANGIYAVANKLPAILSVFENIFYQAWQTSAINAVDDKEKDKFYSNVFKNYLIVLTMGVLGLLIILRPLVIYLFEKSYASAWAVSAILVVGVMIHALGGNLGILYSVFKKTTGALTSSAAGAITNIVLNYIFIPKFGIIAAATTTFIGYVVVLVYRWFDVKKFTRLTFPVANVLETIVFLGTQFILYYFNNPISYSIRVLLCLAYCFIHRSVILRILKRK